MKFTYDYLKKSYLRALELDYKFITCKDYYLINDKKSVNKIIVNRVDVDFSIKKVVYLLELFNDINVKATFFIRLHAPEYNPFSFESYKIVKHILNEGHELGYHSEVIDQSVIWNESAEECLIRDIKVMNLFYGINVKGVASHGGLTGLNNLDFWRNKKPNDYGLLYEAYDTEPSFNLFKNSFYVSDSEWTKWKCYDKGKLLSHNQKEFIDHLEDNHRLIYLLIHSDTYYKTHFYE